MVGPRGIPGIPGERGEQVSLVCLLVVFLEVTFDIKLLYYCGRNISVVFIKNIWKSTLVLHISLSPSNKKEQSLL